MTTSAYERREALCRAGATPSTDRVEPRERARIQPLRAEARAARHDATDPIPRDEQPDRSSQRQRAERERRREAVPQTERHWRWLPRHGCRRERQRASREARARAPTPLRRRQAARGPSHIAGGASCASAGAMESAIERRRACQEACRPEQRAGDHGGGNEDPRRGRPNAPKARHAFVELFLGDKAQRQRHARHRRRSQARGERRSAASNGGGRPAPATSRVPVPCSTAPATRNSAPL